MKTNQITRGAMVCAIYGVLLFLNQQTGLMIEASASWLFVFPVLIYTAMSGPKSFITGYVYGLGLFYQWRNMTNFLICLVFSVLSNVCTVVVWSYLFGYDLVSEFESFRAIIPFIDMGVFIILFVAFLYLLQALCIHLVSLMICIRMHLPYRPLTPISQQKSSKVVGIVSLFIWGIFFLSQNVIECSKGVLDIIMLIWLFDCALLLYYGVIYFMYHSIKRNNRQFSFLAIFLAFVPGINLLWMLMGELDCLFQLRKKV